MKRVVKTPLNLALAYENSKRRVALAGVTAATFTVATAVKYTPKLAKGIGKVYKGAKRGLEKRRRRRETEKPKQTRPIRPNTFGGQRENLLTDETPRPRETVQKEEPVKREEPVQPQTGRFKQWTNKILGVPETVIEGEELRLLGQVVEACKWFNKEIGAEEILYELSPNEVGELNVHLDVKMIRISAEGIYTREGNPYYIKGKMSKNDGINRLLLVYPFKYVNFIVSLLTVFEQDIFKTEEVDGIFKIKEEVKEEEKVDTVETEEYEAFKFGGENK